jgi:sulfite oxidase
MLTLRELKTMGVETTAMVLQCSGNGRGYFPSKPSGTPWQVGAAGCVVWSGVPVRVVAEALGGVGRAWLPDRHRRREAARRPGPAEHHRRALGAGRRDGRRAAGLGDERRADLAGPRRAAAPDRARLQGVNNIKYIKRLAFTAKETEARIMSHGYRISPPGGKGEPSQPSVQEMTVKSWINGPHPTQLA